MLPLKSQLKLNCLDFSNLPETPVSILKTLSDVRVEEDFPATLECEFSRQIIEVKWFKVMKHHKSSTLASVLWGQIKLMKNTCVWYVESEWKGAEGRKELSDLLHGPEEVLSDHAMFSS